MNLLSNPLSPIAPYATAIKLIGAGILALAVLGLAWSWHSRGQSIERMQATDTAIVNAATIATVQPGKDGRRKALRPEDVPAAIQALANSLSSASTTLQGISDGTLKAKAASDAADRALSHQIDVMQDAQPPSDWNPWGDQK